ncbi:MAG: T9SS type A sorting domain-containing protein [Bacteroidota bacterium]|nr:T9SS type A sorting domain-containing protein [Bacteroidota bacterium]MDP4237693.1 T9SS type A sorting domain-containing protein [Bacteroidota bacterium]
MQKSFMRSVLAMASVLILQHGGTTLYAQQGHGYASFLPNSKIHYIGELDTLGEFTCSGSSCQFTSFYQGRSGKFTYVYPYGYSGKEIRGYVMYTPTSLETVFDTVTFHAYSQYDGSGCQYGDIEWNLTAFGSGASDSVFFMRPTYQNISIRSDSLLPQWDQHFQISFDNNTSVPTMIKGWRINENTGSYTLQAFVNNKPVDSYLAKAHERLIPIDFLVTFKHGPIYQDTVRHAIFEATITRNGRDSICRSLLDLSISKAPYTFRSMISENSVYFTNNPGTSDSEIITINLDPATTAHTFGILSHPFSLREVKTSDSTTAVIITCHPRTGGKYAQKLRIEFTKPDFNGDPRIDSLFISLHSDANWLYDEPFWEPATLTRRAEALYSTEIGNIFTWTGKQLYHSGDAGSSWVNMPTPDSANYGFAIGKNGDLYRINAYRQLCKSADDGLTWTFPSVPTFWMNCYPTGYVNLDIFAFAITSDALYVSASKFVSYRCGRSMVSGGGQGTYQQLNGGNQWQGISDACSRICLDSAENIVLITNNSIYYPALSHRWSAPDSITAFAVDTWGNYIVGTQESGMYRSSDNGYSWLQISTAPEIRAIAASPSGELFYCSYGNGVFHSTDDGKTWEGLNGGLTTNTVNDIIAVPGEPLYLATDEEWVVRSKWIVPLKDAVRKAPSAENITFDISPNPVHSNITISYKLPEFISGDLSLHDVLGNEVAVCLGTQNVHGEGSLSIDLSSLPAGIYFFRLQTNAGVITKKIIRY